jgi:hypothetical protein
MTKYRSDFKRPWSVMPMRCFVNRELNDSDLRVLGALCAFTNQHGVCWPSSETLMELTALKSRTSIHRSVQKLKKLKYVRQLNPKDYQETASGWKSNRYQVLWEGDEPVPSWEEVQIAKPLQLIQDQDDVHESTGVIGDEETYSHTQASEVCHAYLRAVQQAMGQVRLFDNEIAHARRLATADKDAEVVASATKVVCALALQKRAGVPSLADVARYLDVQ